MALAARGLTWGMYDDVSEQDVQWMLACFDLIDSKQDGYIDSVELQHAFKSAGRLISWIELDQWVYDHRSLRKGVLGRSDFLRIVLRQLKLCNGALNSASWPPLSVLLSAEGRQGMEASLERRREQTLRPIMESLPDHTSAKSFNPDTTKDPSGTSRKDSSKPQKVKSSDSDIHTKINQKPETSALNLQWGFSKAPTHSVAAPAAAAVKPKPVRTKKVASVADVNCGSLLGSKLNAIFHPSQLVPCGKQHRPFSGQKEKGTLVLPAVPLSQVEKTPKQNNSSLELHDQWQLDSAIGDALTPQGSEASSLGHSSSRSLRPEALLQPSTGQEEVKVVPERSGTDASPVAVILREAARPSLRHSVDLTDEMTQMHALEGSQRHSVGEVAIRDNFLRSHSQKNIAKDCLEVPQTGGRLPRLQKRVSMDRSNSLSKRCEATGTDALVQSVSLKAGPHGPIIVRISEIDEGQQKLDFLSPHSPGHLLSKQMMSPSEAQLRHQDRALLDLSSATHVFAAVC